MSDETQYEGLDEIKKLPAYFVPIRDKFGTVYGMDPINRANETLWDKVNEIIQKVNLLIQIQNSQFGR